MVLKKFVIYEKGLLYYLLKLIYMEKINILMRL